MIRLCFLIKFRPFGGCWSVTELRSGHEFQQFPKGSVCLMLSLNNSQWQSSSGSFQDKPWTKKRP